MSFLDKIAQKLNFRKKTPEEKTRQKTEVRPWASIPEGEGMVDPIYMEIPPDWKLGDYLKAAEGWVYACSSAICDEIATINLRLFEQKGNKIKEVPEHDLLDLLYKVNNFTTKYDHFWLTQDYLELVGEAPWLLDVDPSTKKPVAIYLLRPDKLSIKFDEKKVIGKYVYRVSPTNKLEFEPEQIVFIKYPNPVKPLRGQGTLQAARRTVDLDKYAEEWNVQFFYNAARPDAILTTEQKLSDEQVKRLKKQWDKNFRGIKRRAKLAVLEAGLKYSPMQLSQKDMDFLAQQKFSRDKIFAIFRVPKSIVAITDDVTRSNAEVGAYAFARWTIKPKMRRIVEQLNEFLVPMFGDDLFLDFDDPVPEDVKSKLEKYNSGLKSGWMTPNEVRQEENLLPVEGGDTLYLPANYMPIGISSEARTAKEKKILFNVSLPHRIKKQGFGDIINKQVKIIVKEYLKAKKNHISEKEIQNKPKEIKDLEGFWKRQIEIEEKYEKKFIAKLKNLFSEQEAEVIKKLESVSKGITAKYFGQQDYTREYWSEIKLSIPSILLDLKKENGKFVVTLTPLLRDLIKDAGNYALDEMGSGVEFEETAEVEKYLKKNPIKFADSVNNSTNDKIRRQLAEGIKQGEGIDKLRKRIEIVFEEADKYRSQMIARTETSRAVNFSTVEGYRQSGVVEGKEWLTAYDERVCLRCQAMNGKKIKLDKNFFDKGDEFMGVKIDYSDVGEPPLHVSCRCTVIPILEEVTEKKRIEFELDKMYDKAKSAKVEIDKMVNKTVEDYDGAIAMLASLKGRERAFEKIVGDYGGDVSQITDIARNSIIAKDLSQAETIFNKLSKKVNVVKTRFTASGDDIMGYVGGIVKIKTKNGTIAETQVLTKKMLYGKESPEKVRKILGIEEFNKIKKETGIESGLGHKFYEKWRANSDLEARKLLEKRSTAYYNKLGF